jgi:hypothetical protein
LWHNKDYLKCCFSCFSGNSKYILLPLQITFESLIYFISASLQQHQIYLYVKFRNDGADWSWRRLTASEANNFITHYTKKYMFSHLSWNTRPSCYNFLFFTLRRRHHKIETCIIHNKTHKKTAMTTNIQEGGTQLLAMVTVCVGVTAARRTHILQSAWLQLLLLVVSCKCCWLQPGREGYNSVWLAGNLGACSLVGKLARRRKLINVGGFDWYKALDYN